METKGNPPMKTDEPETGEPPVDKHMKIGSWKMRLPQSRWTRMGLGIALVIGGILGFLPILGFWMIPVGIIILSHDLPRVRRFRRKVELWWHRRRQAKR